MTDDNEQAQQHFDTDFCLVGNISSALTALITQSNYAFHEAKQAIHLSDLVFLVAIAFLPHVVLRFVNNHILNRTIRRKNPLDFIDTAILEPLCKFTCQIGQLGLLTYFGEVFIVFLSGLGVSHLEDKPNYSLRLFTVFGQQRHSPTYSAFSSLVNFLLHVLKRC